MRKTKSILSIIILTAMSLMNVHAETTLKDVFKPYFLIGAALNHREIFEEDRSGAEIVKTQFNTISPENVLKWGMIHSKPDQYNFEAADRYVAFGEKYQMFIIGHTLIWHNQTPDWVFKDAQGNQVTRDELLKRMREHIQTVVGRYKGKINGWDVVNEALNDDGTMRQTPWLKIIGEDYIARAFEYAHEADPKVELYYNEYSLENEAKRQGAIALIKNLQAQGIPVKAVGLQSHDSLNYPSIEKIDQTITDFAKLGVKVNITELDINVLPNAKGFKGADITQNFELQEKLNPYSKGLPDEIQKQLAKRYADIFGVFLKHNKDITRVTFWNVTDGDSWLNNFPIKGRTNYPLLFDRESNSKPAFDAVIQSVQNFSKE